MPAHEAADAADTGEQDEAKPETVEFCGQTFALNPAIPPYTLHKFLQATRRDKNGESFDTFQTSMNFLEKCIAKQDRERFDMVAEDQEPTIDELMAPIYKVLGVEADLPTERPSDSTDGPVSIEPKSDANSDASTSRLDGRPDLKLILERVKEHDRGCVTIRDVCDVSYVIQARQLREWSTPVSSYLSARGAEGVFDLADDYQSSFDKALSGEPGPESMLDMLLKELD